MLKRRRELRMSVSRNFLRKTIVLMWCRKIFKIPKELKQKNTAPFKEEEKKKNKENGNCYTCGKPGHYARECEDSKWKPNKKSTNLIEAEHLAVMPLSYKFVMTDACFNSVDHVSHDNEANVWHSCLCHINFGYMTA
jgi:hypothetical protein